MKKFLSLILVSIMMSTVFVQAEVSTEITDELIKFGIMEGDPDGNLRLEDTITRAEAAKVISALCGFEEFEPTDTPFTDVGEEYWASGYIFFAYTSGIVNGVGDNKFMPEENVTYEQMVKMLVCALGYKPMADSFGSYPFSYMQLASSRGFLSGLNFVGTNAATRGDIAIMLHNTLDVPLMRQNGFGAENSYIIMDGKNGVALETLRTEFFDGYTAEKTLDPESEIPRFSGDEYAGRVLKISDLKKEGDKITFKNALEDTDDDTLYIITDKTFIYESVNTLPLESIEEGLYAQCWHYNNADAEQELLKIEIMKEKPSGVE